MQNRKLSSAALINEGLKESRVLSIDTLLKSWKEKEGGHLLQAVMQFGSECFKNEKLYLYFRNNATNPTQAIRKLSMYYHPDTYRRIYLDLAPEEEKILRETFLLLQTVNDCFKKDKQNALEGEESKQADDLYNTLHALKNSNAASEQANNQSKKNIQRNIHKENLKSLARLEKACFITIRRAHSNVADNIFMSLLREYGRIILLTMNLTIDHDPDFLMENMRGLENHLQHIRPYLKEKKLEEEFEEAFGVSFEPHANQVGALNQLKNILDLSKEDARIKNKQELWTKGIRIVISVCLIAITAGTLSALPLGALALIVIAGIGEIFAVYKKQQALQETREAYFSAYFQGIIRRLETLDPIIRREMEYYEQVRENNSCIPLLKYSNDKKQEEKQETRKPSESNDSVERRAKEQISSNVKTTDSPFFTQQEKKELELLGMECEGISKEEADQLGSLLKIEFSDKEKTFMRSLSIRTKRS
jgi:hypothetical protein